MINEFMLHNGSSRTQMCDTDITDIIQSWVELEFIPAEKMIEVKRILIACT